MKLKTSTSCYVINIPDKLKQKLTFASNIEITKREKFIMEIVLEEITNQLEYENMSIDSLTRVNAIFTKDGSFSMYEENDKTYGNHFSLAIYAMEKIRNTNNEKFMLLVFTEELVHHYWRLEDETKTKYKVLEIIQRIEPEITLDLIKGWGLNGL